jgi:UDP-glucose 4-epimerase
LIYGDGDQVRDFTFVSNVVDANLAAAHAPDASGAVINVATGRRTTVNELADMIGEVLGRPVARDFERSRTGDVKESWADIGAAQELLGWEPSVDLREGLQLTAESMDVETVALS